MEAIRRNTVKVIRRTKCRKMFPPPNILTILSVWFILSLAASLSFLNKATAFPIQQSFPSSSLTLRHTNCPLTTNFQLNALLRPDWLRRASRIKRIQENKNKAVYQSFKDQQKLLGVGKLYRCCNPSTCTCSMGDDSSLQVLLSRTSWKKREGEESKSSTPYTSPSTPLQWKEIYLNVYLTIPEDEYEALDPTNIIHQLQNGDIVKSTAPKEGIWIEHDQGGWSAESLDGMTRLELIGEKEGQEVCSKNGDGW